MYTSSPSFAYPPHQYGRSLTDEIVELQEEMRRLTGLYNDNTRRYGPLHPSGMQVIDQLERHQRRMDELEGRTPTATGSRLLAEQEIDRQRQRRRTRGEWRQAPDPEEIRFQWADEPGDVPF